MALINPNSKKFKNFMAKLYGWGASIVILGALFKLMNWPGAGAMLTIGLGTEAIIFFLSAFEKPHEEPDRSLVYPELAYMKDPDTSSKTPTQELDNMLEKANVIHVHFLKFLEHVFYIVWQLNSNYLAQ